jgi:fluoroacetyl-CoA thioesterase
VSDLQPGLDASVEMTVSDADTAIALGSGDVAVWATPSVVALCEAAAVRAVAEALEDGKTTVGTRIDLEHLAPTPVGATTSAVARLVAVDGRLLTFVVTASDGSGDVAQGTHTRVIVDRERFTSGANAKS